MASLHISFHSSLTQFIGPKNSSLTKSEKVVKSKMAAKNNHDEFKGHTQLSCLHIGSKDLHTFQNKQIP